jgi:hypothetical protein
MLPTHKMVGLPFKPGVRSILRASRFVLGRWQGRVGSLPFITRVWLCDGQSHPATPGDLGYNALARIINSVRLYLI